MSALRRYEILLPLQFNDGDAVADPLLSDALLELRQRFRAVAWETQIIRGAWEHEGLLNIIRSRVLDQMRITVLRASSRGR